MLCFLQNMDLPVWSHLFFRISVSPQPSLANVYQGNTLAGGCICICAFEEGVVFVKAHHGSPSFLLWQIRTNLFLTAFATISSNLCNVSPGTKKGTDMFCLTANGSMGDPRLANCSSRNNRQGAKQILPFLYEIRHDKDLEDKEMSI